MRRIVRRQVVAESIALVDAHQSAPVPARSQGPKNCECLSRRRARSCPQDRRRGRRRGAAHRQEAPSGASAMSDSSWRSRRLRQRCCRSRPKRTASCHRVRKRGRASSVPRRSAGSQFSRRGRRPSSLRCDRESAPRSLASRHRRSAAPAPKGRKQSRTVAASRRRRPRLELDRRPAPPGRKTRTRPAPVSATKMSPFGAMRDDPGQC